jgi:hypothetical protein
MKLIRKDIEEVALLSLDAFCGAYNVPVKTILDYPYWSKRLPEEAMEHYAETIDFAVTGLIAHKAQTFLFDSEQVLAFLAAVDRRLPPGDYPAPFPDMVIQFSEGIDESLFTTGLRLSARKEAEDKLLGLVIATPEEGMPPVANVVAWYSSTSINRIAIPTDGDGTVAYHPFIGTADKGLEETLRADKQRIANLALLCLAYINSPGIEVDHVTADAAVNRKRALKRKRPLPDYYICRLKRRAGESHDAAPTGRHVSFRFDVMGHLRRLENGRTIWIPPHQRGLDHELYKPKVYKVE